MILADKIHAAVRAAAKNHNFPVVEYPGNARATKENETVKAATILANELTSSFAVPRRHRLTYRREKTGWIWELWLAFDRAVSLESFEDEMLANPPIIPRDPDEGTPQVILDFDDVEYRHPPTKNPSSGTRARYRFTANLSPV